MTAAVSCVTCRYWEMTKGSQSTGFDDRPRGACRRQAPRPRSDFDRIIADYLASIAHAVGQSEDEEPFTIHESDAAAESYWPVTVADDWCGEYAVRGKILS